MVGLLPVLIFLIVLVYMDSYKLVRLRVVLGVILAGAAVTVLVFFVNGWLQARMQLDFLHYSRYVAPVVEEFFKAAIIVYLFRSQPHRVSGRQCYFRFCRWCRFCRG